ncbi:Stk1 family PASTA domain-containing Ser/Thr kinase [uncultured Variovorax sp.]|uniref:PASTA domain-containing protein n=1 Tax=uncultured Variovorax sp. TaxID=114708 RepID=UPI0025DA866D|nr:Stk1 family PASTA domain-containing Ser/Thr kinase [uncultured Variovorax sp.]
MPLRSSLTALAFGLALSTPAPAQTVPSAPRLQSDLKDIRVRAVASLPRAGGEASERDGCSWRTIKPKSAAAKLVAAQGWAVMADLPLGAYRAVSFAGRMEPGTSGTCNITQGNVALFDGDRLFALAYGKSADDAAIGNLTPIEGGSVRVWDGGIVGSPVGDLRAEADGTVRLGRVADEESVCQGRASVPNVYGKPVDKARKALAAKGWKPVRIKPDGESRQAELIRHGIVEVESCAGTGLGYCSFSYRGAAGTLSLVTAGESAMPNVVGYNVECR